MSHEERIEQAVTKLESAADMLANIATDHEDRLRDLEATENKGKGILITLGALFTVGLGERLFSWLK